MPSGGGRQIGPTFAALLALAACTAGAQPATGSRPFAVRQGWQFRPGVSFAYDSFGQRYVISDNDTLDLIDELSARLHTSVEHFGRTHFRLQNALGYGQEATRDDLVAGLQQPLGRRTEFRADQELHYKAYAPNSDYALSSDYLVGTTRAAALFRPAPQWRLRVDDRFEATWFRNPGRYNYAYRLNDTGAEIERSYGLLSRLRLGYTYGWRSVPDSTAIDYQRHIVITDWEHGIGLHGLGIEQRAERRFFGDPTVRSHYWDYNGTLYGHVFLHEHARLRPEYRGTVTHYDRPDSLWSNATEQSAELLIEGDISARTVLAVGPRGEFRRTSSAVDRAYNQWGLKGSVTLALGNTLWLQFTDEIGLRRHFAGEDLLFSDYTFNWSTLYLSWLPAPRVGLDLFFSLSPESHQDKTNDTTTLLLSAAMTYGWR